MTSTRQAPGQPVWYRRIPVVVLATALVLVAAPRRILAHEVPNDVTIRAFLKAEGPRLRMLVRVPLIAMRDMTWPLRAPGVLDLTRANAELDNAAMLWLGAEAAVFEDDDPLAEPKVAAVRASLQHDRSFDSYEQALALVTGPREPDTTDVTIKDDFLDVLFEYPIQSDRSRFSIRTRWADLGLKTLTIVRLVTPDGERRFELEGNPGFVRLDPTTFQAASLFAGLGFNYLLAGAESVLFLVCLVLPFRRAADVAVLAVAFTVAFSTTFMASAYGHAPDTLWFRPLIDMLVAGAVVYLAGENVVGTRVGRRWRQAVWFGLVFGFAFAFPLHPTIQLAGAHAGLSLAAFNAGLGLAGFVTVAAVATLTTVLFRFVVTDTVGTIVASALAGHAAWHWLTTRAALLWQYRFAPPEFDAAFLADLLRWTIFIVAVAGLVWLVSVVAETRQAKSFLIRLFRWSQS
jgi:hypothetical protein